MTVFDPNAQAAPDMQSRPRPAMQRAPMPTSRRAQTAATLTGVTRIVLDALAPKSKTRRQVLSEDDVSALEWAATVDGALSSFREVLRAGARVMRRGSQPPIAPQREISAETHDIVTGSPLGQCLDLANVVLGVSDHSVTAHNGLFQLFGNRAELYTAALRQTVKEIREDQTPGDMLTHRAIALVNDPPPRLKAITTDSTRVKRFEDAPAKLAAWIDDRRRRDPELQILLPALEPVAGLFAHEMKGTPLAALVKRWKAEIDAVDERGDLALARMTLAANVLLSLIDYARAGVLTPQGPADPAKRALLGPDWQPHAVRIGPRFVPMGEFGAIGLPLIMAAEFAEALPAMNGKDWERRGEEVYAALTFALAEKITGQSCLTAFAALFEAIADPAQARPPASADGNQAPHLDPYTRTAGEMLKAFRARIPGLSSKVSAGRDGFGRPKADLAELGGIYRRAPRTQPREPEPVDEEAERQDAAFDAPDAVQDFSDAGLPGEVDLSDDPELYDRFIDLATNGAKLSEVILSGEAIELTRPLGAKDLINAIVSGKHELSGEYRTLSSGPRGGKIGFIESIRQAAEDAAKTQLLNDPRFKRLMQQQPAEDTVPQDAIDPSLEQAEPSDAAEMPLRTSPSATDPPIGPN